LGDEAGGGADASGPAAAPGPELPGRRIRRERWDRLRRSLWQPPRHHGEQPEKRVVGPLELFYDLAVVLLVAQAAHRLAVHLTWAGLGEFAVIFKLVWTAWVNGSLHHELHGHEDAMARNTFRVWCPNPLACLLVAKLLRHKACAEDAMLGAAAPIGGQSSPYARSPGGEGLLRR
jgi:Bacterial low temperature requirement A protein (LtrA)